MKKKSSVCYYANANNTEECLRNGSFVRTSKYRGAELVARYILGDYDMLLGSVPNGMVLVDTEFAKSLIPKCCK